LLSILASDSLNDMESDSDPRARTPDTAEAASAALGALEEDRADLAARMRAQTRWAAPAQGGATALLVAAPVAGLPWMMLLSAVAVLALLGVEKRFRARSGLSITRPAGPLGVLVLLVTLLVMASGVAISLVLSLSGEPGSALLVALAVFVIATGLVVAYDRVYAREVRRVR
jgi:hypothetical protein